jgi:dolichyl-diphosphooligosaccharide--protein glycosyltransferase
MVRLLLTLTPVVCIAAAIAFTTMIETYSHSISDGVESVEEKKPVKVKKPNGSADSSLKYVIVVPITIILSIFAWHCTYVTSTAYSSPSVVLATQGRDGNQHIIDDFREAYFWLRQNTDEKAKILSWWDYGYVI